MPAFFEDEISFVKILQLPGRSIFKQDFKGGSKILLQKRKK